MQQPSITRGPTQEDQHKRTSTRGPTQEDQHKRTNTRGPAQKDQHKRANTRGPTQEVQHKRTNTRGPTEFPSIRNIRQTSERCRGKDGLIYMPTAFPLLFSGMGEEGAQEHKEGGGGGDRREWSNRISIVLGCLLL